MAKQLGIHQIRGKVGERSYYKTKGVEAGISRSINQGLSARVKGAAEYANTRLNNAEFKNANAIATAAFRSVLNRNRGMMVNFAVADMTKRALDDIKQGTGAWGARHPFTELDALICDMLENHAKAQSTLVDLVDISFGVLDAEGVVSSTVTISKEKQLTMMELGIDGVQLVASRCLAGEIDIDGAPRLFAGSGVSPQQPIPFTGESDITVSFSMTFSTPASVGMSQSGFTFAQEDPKHGFFVVTTILPFRTLGANRYVLQEYCTYVTHAYGQIPE